MESQIHQLNDSNARLQKAAAAQAQQQQTADNASAVSNLQGAVVYQHSIRQFLPPLGEEISLSC
jgi:hypothetical protein